ncbi:MAG: DinB family protein [Frankiaceae bacterium]|nr:DinB family protein [Frankiaceae bacterium]
MFIEPADDPREKDATSLGDEKATLVEYLRAYRLTLELKCAGLDNEQLARRSVEPSSMSLLGLIRHMAEVERYWFRRVLSAKDAPRRYSAEGVKDGDFDGAVADDGIVGEAWTAWREEVAFAQDVVAREDDMGRVAIDRHGNKVSVREVLVHMVEEYARHCGHADLLRERIDGRVGQ